MVGNKGFFVAGIDVIEDTIENIKRKEQQV